MFCSKYGNVYCNNILEVQDSKIFHENTFSSEWSGVLFVLVRIYVRFSRLFCNYLQYSFANSD